ncbi:MAG: YdcF family protein [Oscillospiraceae bacterium]|nr:YdcF family protein [Oscillospiraceae bacterium]
MKKLRGKKLVILVSLLVVFLIILFAIITAVNITHYGKVDEKAHCDVAIILGAATSDGEVSPVYRERINHGIWLYENGYVDYLILTGGIGNGNEISDAFAAKQYAIKKGVPEQVIYIEEKSTITEENLEYAKAIMDEHSLDTAIIVSDPLHMKRAMLMASDYGIDACSSPTPTTMYRSAKTQIPFLAREVFFYIGYSIVRVFR